MKATTATVAAVGLAALLGGGLMLWRSTSVAHGAGSGDGRTISVDVVPPVEPDLIPGAVMTVGDLTNGYEHDPEKLAPLPVDPTQEGALDSAWVEPEPPRPRTVIVVEPVRTPPPPSPIRLEPDDYGFGFDQPLPSSLDEAESNMKTAPIDPTGAA
ncbi:hypothetical protein ACFPIF_16040 [Brevundimonas faecalis]|uniref:hypothetical protein n=1 Tax=Brevundimonas faecalis TaxID=947378 RepID=UPI003608D6A0